MPPSTTLSHAPVRGSAAQEIGHQLFSRFARAIGRVGFQLGKQPLHIQRETRHQVARQTPALQEVAIDALRQVRIELVPSVEPAQISRAGGLYLRFLESDGVAPNRTTVVEQFERA